MSTSGTALEDVARVIRAKDEQFSKDLKSGDIARLVNNFYADGARLLPPGMPMAEGKTAIQAVFEGMYNAGVSSVELDTTVVDSSGDLAYGLGTARLPDSVGKYVVVYRRQADGDWKAIADIFNMNQ